MSDSTLLNSLPKIYFDRKKNGSVQKNVGSHSGSFQTVIPFLP